MMKIVTALEKISREFKFLFGDGEFTIEVNDHKFKRLLYELREHPKNDDRDDVTFYFQDGIVTVKRKRDSIFIRKKDPEYVWVDENPNCDLTLDQLKAAVFTTTLSGITCTDGKTDSHEPELVHAGWVVCKKCGFSCLPYQGPAG